jgi:hypothetical protein
MKSKVRSPHCTACCSAVVGADVLVLADGVGEMLHCEQLCLRQAALAKLAYVYLALGDSVSALSTATQLLQTPGCQEPWRYGSRWNVLGGLSPSFFLAFCVMLTLPYPRSLTRSVCLLAPPPLRRCRRCELLSVSLSPLIPLLM